MIKQSKSSFRWILLSRILLLTVPVLLLGQYVTYRKARSTLLETARQNLTESAIRKAETIENSLKALQSNLVSASESYVLRSADSLSYQEFVDRLDERLASQVDCIQLTDLETNQLVSSNCGTQGMKSLITNLGPQEPELTGENSKVNVTYLLPNNASANEGHISLAMRVPVYVMVPGTEELKLRYVLSVKWPLPLEKNAIKGSLSGSTVIIDEGRTILAHPNSNRVGRTIKEEKDASRLETIIKNALAGNQDFIHLFSFETNNLEVIESENPNFFTFIGVKVNNLKKYLSELLGLRLSEENELLAGYAATVNPIATDNNNRWVILAITPLGYALSGLEEIQQVLLNLIIGLVVTSIIAAIYVARTLAHPLEKLRDYAISVNDLDSPQQVPQNLKTREFNQLAEALNSMVERLTAWAEELEKASKEANIANELKSEFLTKISHELRTPLNGIIGSIQLILDGFCDDREEEIEYLQQGHDSAIHLLQIVDDILDLRKIESGAMSMLLEDTNLTEVLFEAIAQKEETIVAKGLELNKPSLSEAIFVDADPEKLKQVFLHVLSNAIKFTEKGSITILVEVDRLPNNSDLAKVKVEDTGIGIDMTVPESKGKIFGAFQAIDAGKTKKFGGMGLGLTISLHLIQAMRGSIDIDSNGIDKGTLVTVTLPIKKRESSAKVSNEETVNTYSS